MTDQSRFAAHVCCLVVRTRRSYVEHACTQTCFFVKQGCCALSTCFDPCLLALPSSSTRGTMRVYNAGITGSSVECEVTAHNSPVAVMAWNQDASLLASASNKGTVLRVHKMPQVMTALRQPNSVVAAALGQMYLLSVALEHCHQSMIALEKAHSNKQQQNLAVQGFSNCCQAEKHVRSPSESACANEEPSSSTHASSSSAFAFMDLALHHVSIDLHHVIAELFVTSVLHG